MARTITPTTLTTNVSEQITLNGTTFDSTTTYTINNVGNFVNNVFSVASGSQDILTFSRAGVGHRNGEYDIDKIKYLRLTNSDDTNTVTLKLTYISGDQEVVIAAGGSFVLTNFFGPTGTTDNLSLIEITATADIDIPYSIGLITS